VKNRAVTLNLTDEEKIPFLTSPALGQRTRPVGAQHSMAAPQHDEFGFKRLSSENWLTPDSIWNVFTPPEPPLTQAETWGRDVLALSLDPAVPLTIRKLYEPARGALLYGLLYYPLLTLGTEQIFRVLEAAVSNKCATLDAPPKVKDFGPKLDWLLKMETINQNQHSLWHIMRELRNDASHPRDQSIFDPNLTLQMLRSAVELIDSLFVQNSAN
jgi:hypothetical protein